MKAIVIGATGATGKELVNLLLADTKVESVIVFVRRQIQIDHPKLRTHQIDFNRPEDWKEQVKGDVLFCCLGTTLKDAGSKEAQWKIDHDYQLWFAQAAKNNKVPCCVLVSAIGASSKSNIFYSRMKGELEEAISKLNFAKFLIFQPPLLLRENSDRIMEIVAAKIIRFFNNLGLLRSQQPLATKDLAKAMLIAASQASSGKHIYKGQSIRLIGKAT
ncbi:MAG: NAD(P)H-binding protein [Bacteroidia bacterium]|nr:NAD(P)H-binding protein [Bacteroidia bacterium]